MYLAQFAQCDDSEILRRLSTTPLKDIRGAPLELVPWTSGKALPGDTAVRIVGAARALRRAKHSRELFITAVRDRKDGERKAMGQSRSGARG